MKKWRALRKLFLSSLEIPLMTVRFTVRGVVGSGSYKVQMASAIERFEYSLRKLLPSSFLIAPTRIVFGVFRDPRPTKLTQNLNRYLQITTNVSLFKSFLNTLLDCRGRVGLLYGADMRLTHDYIFKFSE